MSVRSSDHLNIAEGDVVLPLVPMFHANSWGLLHGALVAGATLVLPGPATTGVPVADLMVETKEVSRPGCRRYGIRRCLNSCHATPPG